MKKLLSTLIISLAAFSAQADTIKLVVGYAPGGGADKVARLLQQIIQPTTAKNVVVEFKLGAGSEISTAFVAQYSGDDTVLLLQTAAMASHTTNPAYDITKDLIPVAYIGANPFILVANSSYPHKTVDAIKNLPPGVKLNIGSGGIGTLTYRFGVGLGELAPKNSVVVPFKGGAEILTPLLNNEINMAFMSPALVKQHITTGKLVPVAVTSEQRLADFGNVPTIAELGLKRQGAGTWYMLFSNKTPKTLEIDAIRAALVKALQQPNIVQALRDVDAYPDPKKTLQGSAILAEEIRHAK